jgi:glutathione S-transferase
MSLKFYYSPMSTASITTLVLEELGVSCERIKVDIQKGETKKADFLKVNPNGKVPVIVHDGSVIFESAAITMYLGETFGVDKKLYPAAGPKRGEAMKWIVWSSATLGEAAGRWMRNTLDWVPKEQQNAKAGEAALKEAQDCLGILDQSLGTKPFLVDDYSLADAHVNSLVDWLRHMKLDFAPYERLNAWSKRCAARPAYSKAMAMETK